MINKKEQIVFEEPNKIIIESQSDNQEIKNNEVSIKQDKVKTQIPKQLLYGKLLKMNKGK